MPAGQSQDSSGDTTETDNILVVSFLAANDGCFRLSQQLFPNQAEKEICRVVMSGVLGSWQQGQTANRTTQLPMEMLKTHMETWKLGMGDEVF